MLYSIEWDYSTTKSGQLDINSRYFSSTTIYWVCFPAFGIAFKVFVHPCSHHWRRHFHWNCLTKLYWQVIILIPTKTVLQIEMMVLSITFVSLKATYQLSTVQPTNHYISYHSLTRLTFKQPIIIVIIHRWQLNFSKHT